MTRMFQLDEQEAHLSNVNHRIEKFGDEGNKLACDLELSFVTSNDFLSELHPTLKWSLYDRPEKPDLADTDTHMPVLRYSKIEKINWTQEWVNCELTIHRLKDDILLTDCKVNKVRIEPSDGGSVTIKFRVQYYPDPTKPAVMGKIDAMLEDGLAMISLSRPLDDESETEQPQKPLTNTPEPNPVEKRAANDDDDETEEAPASGRGRGRGRRTASVE